MRRRFLFEILIFAWILTVGALTPQIRSTLNAADGMAYDRLLPLAARKIDPTLLIVAIDQRSLEALGRWPWGRDVHADLLTQIAQAKPKAVFLDLFLAEPTTEDDALAAAIAQVPTFLPLLRAASVDDRGDVRVRFSPPAGPLAAAARGLGHAELIPDVDGIARQLYLEQGPVGRLERYVGLEVIGSTALEAPSSWVDRGEWRLQHPLNIAFAGGRGGYPTVSYVNVLRGEVAPELLRDRIILVGATAPGLGDQVLTPNIATGGILSGVELHANAIDNLLHGYGIAKVPDALSILWTCVVVWLATWLFLRYGHLALPVALTLSGVILLASGIGMRAHIWMSPVAPVVSVSLMYLFWSWRRLHLQFHLLRKGARDLDRVPEASFEWSAPSAIRTTGRRGVRETERLRRAAGRLTHLQHLMSSAMATMPVGVLVCDSKGRIRTSNPAARSMVLHALMPADVDSATMDPLAGKDLRSILAPMETSVANPAVDAPLAQWAGEYVTPEGRTIQLRVAEVTNLPGASPTGVVVTLNDLSEEREIERQREEWRRFLSHDLRSPQVNILSWLTLHEDGQPVPDLVGVIRRESERTLSLAESFLEVAEAESGRYHFTEAHLGGLLTDVQEQVSGYALQEGVRVDVQMSSAEEAIVFADATLLRRAIVNLVNNAVRFSAKGSTVRLCAALEYVDGRVSATLAISVGDEGQGMNDAQLQSLISGAATIKPSLAGGQQGNFGLGWEIIRSVVRRHGGNLGGIGAPGSGCMFWLELPIVVHGVVEAEFGSSQDG